MVFFINTSLIFLFKILGRSYNMALQFPGYESLDKGVYVRDSGTIEGIALKGVLKVERFVEVNEQAVVDYLQREAAVAFRKPNLILPGGMTASFGSDTSDVQKALRALPSKVLNDLKSGQTDCIQFIRSNTPARALKEGEQPNHYVTIKYNIGIPATAEGKIDETTAQKILLSPQIINQHLFLRYTLDGENLPPRETMNHLLRRGTWGDPQVIIDPARYDCSLALELQATVYDALKTAGVEDLPNISQKVLESVSLPPIETLMQSLMMASIQHQQLKRGDSPSALIDLLKGGKRGKGR